MAFKRICLIFAGGTITGVRGQVGGQSVITFPTTHIELLQTVPELRKLQQFALPGGLVDGPANLGEDDVEYYQAIDSTNIAPPNWLDIARLIYARKDRYDGFVVTHGTDTMIYTASALAFLLRGLNKPIVFTGAQLPVVGELVTDARNNLVNAFRVAAQDLQEVVICLGSHIVRATRARKISEFDGDAFTSTEVPPLGRIGIRLHIDYTIARRASMSTATLMKLDLHWAHEVALVKLYPGMTPDTLRAILFSGLRGVVLEGFGAGNIPDEHAGRYNLIRPVQEAVGQHVAIALCPQVPIGPGDIFLNTVTPYFEGGVISARDMVPEVAVTKLMWSLGQTPFTDEAALVKIAERMQTPFVDEITAE